MKKLRTLIMLALIGLSSNTYTTTKAVLLEHVKKLCGSKTPSYIERLNKQELEIFIKEKEAQGTHSDKLATCDAQTQTSDFIGMNDVTGIDWEQFISQIHSFDSITVTSLLAPGKIFVVKTTNILEKSQLIRDLYESSKDSIETTTQAETIETSLHPLLLEMLQKDTDCCHHDKACTVSLPEFAILLDQATYLNCIYPLLQSEWCSIKKMLESYDGKTALTQYPDTLKKIILLTDNLLWLPEDQNHPLIATEYVFFYLASAIERNCLRISIKNDEVLRLFLECCRKNPQFAQSIFDLTIENCTLSEFDLSYTCSQELHVICLRIISCQNLTSIRQIKAREELSITDCPKLVSIAHIVSNQNLRTVHIERCENLTELGKANSVEFLSLSNCEHLVNVTMAQKFHWLSISNCPRVSKLGEISEVSDTLFCCNLENLTSIPSGKKILRVTITQCPQLQSLGKLEFVGESLALSDNELLNISSLMYAQEATIMNCPHAHISEQMRLLLGDRYTNNLDIR